MITEVKRIHEEAKAAVLRIDRNSEDPIIGSEKATWGSYLRYLGFHAAYHAGRAYPVRHLLGHTTPDT